MEHTTKHFRNWAESIIKELNLAGFQHHGKSPIHLDDFDTAGHFIRHLVVMRQDVYHFCRMRGLIYDNQCPITGGAPEGDWSIYGRYINLSQEGIRFLQNEPLPGIKGMTEEAKRFLEEDRRRFVESMRQDSLSNNTGCILLITPIVLGTILYFLL